MFQVGDLVDVNPAIITGIYAAKFREMGCEAPHIGWTILNHRTLFDNGVPYTEWLADRGEVQGWVEEKNLVARPPEPPKVADKAKFAVDDEVDLKPGCWIEIDGVPVTVQGSTMAGSGWSIVAVKDNRYLVTTDAITGWVSASAVVARAKPELLPTTLTMRVADLSAEDDGRMRVNLYDGVSGASVFTASIDHSIRLGDEYTVTIAKKG